MAVATEHSAANELIDGLRDAATALKELGDENLRLKDENDHLWQEKDSLERELLDERSARDELAEWRVLLEDFNRGIRDRDELIEGTVGRE